MPFINVRLIDDGVTSDQKAQIIRGVTEVMVETLGKKPGGVYVVIDEVPLDNWGVEYESVTARRAKMVPAEGNGTAADETGAPLAAHVKGTGQNSNLRTGEPNS
jgi:4-oxalocrotonate tautomerase